MSKLRLCLTTVTMCLRAKLLSSLENKIADILSIIPDVVCTKLTSYERSYWVRWMTMAYARVFLTPVSLVDSARVCIVTKSRGTRLKLSCSLATMCWPWMDTSSPRAGRYLDERSYEVSPRGRANFHTSVHSAEMFLCSLCAFSLPESC